MSGVRLCTPAVAPSDMYQHSAIKMLQPSEFKLSYMHMCMCMHMHINMYITQL